MRQLQYIPWGQIRQMYHRRYKRLRRGRCMAEKAMCAAGLMGMAVMVLMWMLF